MSLSNLRFYIGQLSQISAGDKVKQGDKQALIHQWVMVRSAEQYPSHPALRPAAIDLCRALAAETAAEAVILFGSQAGRGWDEQSDLDMIIIHPTTDLQDNRRKVLGRVLSEIRERHYPGHGEYDSPHHGVTDGLIVESPENYQAVAAP